MSSFIPNVLTKIASHIIKRERLTQLIYKATTNDLQIKERPEINQWAKINKLDMHGLDQIMLLRLLNSSEPRMCFPCISQIIFCV